VVSGVIISDKDTSISKFGTESIKFTVADVAEVGGGGNSSRGVVDLNFGEKRTVNESLSFWIKVPSDYYIDNPATGVSLKSMAILVVSLFDDSTKTFEKVIYTEYAFHPEWMLYKIIDDTAKGKIFNKIQINLLTFDNHPNMVFWIDSFVLDQRAIPTLSITMDNDGVGCTPDWFSDCFSKVTPLTMRTKLNATDIDPYPVQLGKEGYFRGLFDDSCYSGNARNLSTYSEQVDYLNNDSLHGRIINLNKAFPQRDIITCLSAHGYLNDALRISEMAAGFKIIRCGNAYYRANYIDKESNVIQSAQFGSIAGDLTVSDAWITDQINLGKAYIDELIDYGSHGCILTHQIVKRSEISGADLNLGCVYEVMAAIVDYVNSKRALGLIRVISLQRLYERSVNN
jgi:hypothetical protein